MDAYLQRLQEGIQSATQGMSGEDLLRHPEGKWCAAEILEHLYLTYTGTTKAFERCLQAGQPQVRARVLRDRDEDHCGRWIGTHAQGPTISETCSAPRDVAGRSHSRNRVAHLRHGRSHCAVRIPLWQAKPIARSSYLGPLTGRQWRKFHWVHGHHHLKQIQGLRQQS
jgi:hypothetical protein